MTDALAHSPERSVMGEWLTIERSTARKPEGVIATVVISSAADAPVGIRVREDLPDSWAVTEVGVHPDFEPPELAAGTDRVEYADVVYPDERRTFVYGVRVGSSNDLEPLPDPVIVSERRLDDRAVDPDGAPETDRPGESGEVGADAEPATGRNRPDESRPGEDAPELVDGLDAPLEAPDHDVVDTETPASVEEGPRSEAPDPASAGDDHESARADAGDDPFELDANAGDGAPEPADDPAIGPGAGRAGEPDGVDEPDWGGADDTDQDGADDADPDGVEEPDGDGADESVPGDPADGERANPSAGEGAGEAVAGDGGLTEPPGAVLDDATNLLVLADHDEAGPSCARLIDRQLADGDELVLVSFVETPDDRLEAVAGLTADPGGVDVLCMGDPHRSSSVADSTVSTPLGEATVTSIADSTDLFRLGVHISRALDETSGEPVVCLHSLTALVGLVEIQRVFRFLHVLSGRVRATDTRAHYHLDPTAVDEQTVGTLEPLFDAVVRFEGGHWVAE